MANSDILWVLSSDHREVEQIFAEIDRAPVGSGLRRELVHQLTIVGVRHAVCEELYLYPLVRAHLNRGDELAGRALDDHAGLERMLGELEDLSPGDVRFDDLVARVRLSGVEHVDYEENDLFPKVAAACPPDELTTLGRKTRWARDSVPSRPDHPDRPRPGPDVIDRIRRTVTEADPG